MQKKIPDAFKSPTVTAATLTILLIALVQITGCGPNPPVQFQELQVQDTEASEGYDVYLFVAINKPGNQPTTAEDVTALLEWFRDVRFADVNKIKVFVWSNPQAALIMASGDLMGEMTVDREAEIERLDIYIE